MGNGQSVSACLSLVTWALVSQKTNGFETPQPCSIEPNDEILTCRLHDFFGDDRQLVGSKHAFDLLQQTVNQAHVSLGDANDGGNRFLIRKIR